MYLWLLTELQPKYFFLLIDHIKISELQSVILEKALSKTDTRKLLSMDIRTFQELTEEGYLVITHYPFIRRIIIFIPFTFAAKSPSTHTSHVLLLWVWGCWFTDANPDTIIVERRQRDLCSGPQLSCLIPTYKLVMLYKNMMLPQCQQLAAQFCNSFEMKK